MPDERRIESVDEALAVVAKRTIVSPLAGCTVAVRRIDRMTVVGPIARGCEVMAWLRMEGWAVKESGPVTMRYERIGSVVDSIVDRTRFLFVAERDADPIEVLPDKRSVEPPVVNNPPTWDPGCGCTVTYGQRCPMCGCP